MPSIKQYYDINRPVPFTDVQVDCDNRRFVDPRAVRLTRTPEPFATQAVRSIDSLFDEVKRCVLSTSTADHRRGERLLQQFNEPWDTRLGMASTGFYGHGGSAGIGADLWAQLRGNLRALVEIGIFKHLEYIPVCVARVDNDVTSDLTTRVIYQALADFTGQMLIDFPEFSAGSHRASVFTRPVWSSTKLEWENREITLPVADGKPLLLVPSEWTRGRILVSARRFYDTTMLTSVQRSRGAIVEGKVKTTPKDQLRQDPELRRGRATIVAQTLRAHLQRGENLFDDFDDFVVDRFE